MSSFPTPDQIEAQYFQILKSIKPSININDSNSDFVIRGKVLSGLSSGIYGDQQKVNNDTFVSSARPEALILKGLDLGISRQPATQAESVQVRISGVNGTVISPGDLTLIYSATNILYINLTGGIIAGGILDVVIRSQATGQIGNVIAPDTLNLVSPPAGVSQVANLIQSLADGSDIETIDSLRARILSRQQQPPAGGNSTDYPNFAFEANTSVRSAFVRRFGRGLGTVDIYITTGTTDVDTAITNGLAINRIPSSIVLSAVQDFYNAHVPLTDCPRVYAPVEILENVSVKVVLAFGLILTSVPSSVYNPLGLTCLQLIQREVGRVLYKLPVGGRILPGSLNGFITASDIEAGLDEWLSAVKNQTTGLPVGKIPILADRQCQPLDGLNINKAIGQNELAKPNVVTVTLGI